MRLVLISYLEKKTSIMKLKYMRHTEKNKITPKKVRK
jgi:hypothetical protein